jgi:NodT family efflux transporter outer membrane factor (OMF) lipoprotein
VLLGETPGFTRKLVDAPAPIPEAPSQIVLTAPAEVIAQRPDIRAAERRVAAATAQQGVATAKFYPDISLNGFFGLLSTSADTLMTGGSEAWSMGGGVLWPILNIGTLSANLDETKAEQKEALITYRKTVLTALADVETALASYNEEQQALQAASQQSSENHHAVAIAAERYKAGITSYGDVLTADQTLYDAQMSQVKARAMASADLVALYKSLGGGWQQK